MRPTDERTRRAQAAVRPARAADCERLREITVASKGSWGYPPAQTRAWVKSLDICAAMLARTETVVAERGGRVVAWAQLLPPKAGVCVFDHLWVDPAAMGAGVGTELFRWAAARACALGATVMEWEGEPNAVGFYERMGGRQVRTVTSEWGRELPVMAVDVGAGSGPGAPAPPN
jgi:GNAT superfamily N-acetyltransferase